MLKGNIETEAEKRNIQKNCFYIKNKRRKKKKNYEIELIV